MKNRYAILLPLLLLLVNIAVTTVAVAQSTEILPGLVLPQMTTAQREAMTTPTEGSLVFDTTTKTYWFYKNSAWVELTASSGYWQLSGAAGNEIMNTNTGGFWSKSSSVVSFSANDDSNPPTAPVSGFGTRLMWIPSRSAFRVGTTDDNSWAPANIGLFSFATGYQTQAKGKFSSSFGYQSKANGTFSFAMGSQAIADSSGSFAFGNGAIASGINAMAFGDDAKATEESSIAIGRDVESTGMASVCIGNMTKSGGEGSVALGRSTEATGNYAFAAGYLSIANKESSIAIGRAVTASGINSTALGALMDTNNKKGAFMIGDTDPGSEGKTYVGTNDQFVARFKNGYYLLTSGNTTRTGASMLSGQTAWNAISDSTRKERFVAANGEDFLTRLRSLRLGSWNYKNQQTAQPERFYGPMAQELFSAFGKDKYGTIGTDTTVSTINMDGLLFIFSQALEKRTTDLQTENQQLKAEMLEMKEETRTLKALIQQLDARLASIELYDTKAIQQSSKMKASMAKKDLPDKQEIVNDK